MGWKGIQGQRVGLEIQVGRNNYAFVEEHLTSPRHTKVSSSCTGFMGPVGQKGMPGINGRPGVPGFRGEVGQMGHPGLQGMEGGS